MRWRETTARGRRGNSVCAKDNTGAGRAGEMAFVKQPLARLELLDPADNLEERHLRG